MKLIVLMLSIVLASCTATSFVQGNIESFNNFEGSLKGSIYIEAGSDDKKGKLEFVSYKNKLKNSLMNLESSIHRRTVLMQITCYF